MCERLVDFHYPCSLQLPALASQSDKVFLTPIPLVDPDTYLKKNYDLIREFAVFANDQIFTPESREHLNPDFVPNYAHIIPYFLDVLRYPDYPHFLIQSSAGDTAGTVGYCSEWIHGGGELANINIFLNHNYWGQGIGSQTIHILEDISRASGVRRLKAEIAKNNNRSRGLCEKNGFSYLKNRAKPYAEYQIFTKDI